MEHPPSIPTASPGAECEGGGGAILTVRTPANQCRAQGLDASELQAILDYIATLEAQPPAPSAGLFEAAKGAVEALKDATFKLNGYQECPMFDEPPKKLEAALAASQYPKPEASADPSQL